MIRNKLAGVIAGAVLIGGVSLGLSHTNKIVNYKTATSIHSENNILLAAPINNNGNKAVVVNTNKSPLVLYTNPTSGLNSHISGYISVGEMLTVESSATNGFYKVKIQETGETGYISAYNIQFIESGVNKEVTNVNKKGYVINVDTQVHLRASATMNSNVLENFYNNTLLRVLSKQGNWYKVQVGNVTGYLYGEYVGLTNENLGEVTTSTTKTSVSKANKNVSAPNTNYKYTIQESVVLPNENPIVPVTTVYNGNEFSNNEIIPVNIPVGYELRRVRIFDGKQEIASIGIRTNNPNQIKEAISNLKINPKSGVILVQYVVQVIPAQQKEINQEQENSKIKVQKMDIEAYAGTLMPTTKIGENESLENQINMTQKQLAKYKMTMTKNLYSYNGVTIKNPQYYLVTYPSTYVFGNMSMGGYNIKGLNEDGNISIILAVPKGQNAERVYHEMAPVFNYPVLLNGKVCGFLQQSGQVYEFNYIK